MRFSPEDAVRAIPNRAQHLPPNKGQNTKQAKAIGQAKRALRTSAL